MKARLCTVKDIAESRERRANQIAFFLKQYNSPVVVLTLNIPGAKKVSPIYEKAFTVGVNDLKLECSEKFKSNKGIYNLGIKIFEKLGLEKRIRK